MFVGATSGGSSSGVNVTLTIPATAQEGDVAWVIVDCHETAVTTMPAGWVSREAVGSSGKGRDRYTHTVGAGEPGQDVTISTSSVGKWIVQLLVLRGVDPDSPEAAETPTTTIADGLLDIPPASSTQAADQIIVAGSRDPLITAYTPPAGWTDAGTGTYYDGGGSQQATVAYRENVPAGAISGTWGIDAGTGTDTASSLIITNPVAPTHTRFRYNGTEWVPLGVPQIIGGAAPAALYKPLMGAGGGPKAEQWDPLDAAVGPMLAYRSYDGALPASFANSAASSDVAAGRHSYWSWKPSVTGFPGSTSQKGAFAAFLGTIPAGHKVTIFGHHEPENDMPGDFTINQFGALQDACATIVRDHGNPNVRFGPCFMGPWTWDSRSPYYEWIDQWGTVMDWSQFDVVGIDPYASIHPDGISLEDMLTVRNSGGGSGSSNVLSVMEHLSQFDLPVGIVEWGYYRKQPAGHGPLEPPVNPIPDQVVADWITDAYEWMKAWNADHPPRIEGGRTVGPFIDCALWFNYSLLGADTPLTGPLSNPTTEGPKIDAYAAIVADSKLP